MHRAPATAAARLQESRRRYDRVVDVVRDRAGRGDFEGVLRGATVAANLAWHAPIGLLGDPGLERLVVGLAQRGGPAPTVDGTRAAGRVLHVLSEAYDFGGHTRLAWRWMARDGRRSDVALTNHSGPVPTPLRRAAHASHGQVFDLRGAFSGLTERAAALRRLMDQADVVVAHVHPYDAVALAAASLPGPRPPVVYENHADFTFWLGLGSTDLVADHRQRSARLTSELRGVQSRRLGLLPLPVEVPAEADRARIRRSLGIAPDDVLALSVAAAPKMAPVWGRGFEAVLDQVLSSNPRIRVALVGVPAEGAWARLAERFRGRLLPVGLVADPDPWYAAADLYLNAYPLPGGTSVLEAAAAGLPVVTLQDLGEQYGHAAVYQSDSPGLADVRHAVATEDQYLARVRRLVRDPGMRAEEGAAARAAVLAAHTGEGWAGSLERLYDQARSVPAADLDEYPGPVEDLDYGAMLTSFAGGGGPLPEAAQMAVTLGPLADDELLLDLFAAAHRDGGPSLAVRVGTGWEDHAAWTMRLLTLTGRHPRLAVSLPFVAGDDAEGSGSVAHLTALLALISTTIDDCGDISLDTVAPETTGPAVSGELALTADSLDRLEALVSSPCWAAETPATIAPRRPALAR